MTGPSSTPRGERTPRPGIRWSTTVGWSGEQLADDDAPAPRPNRATRRALARARQTQTTAEEQQQLLGCACTYGERCPRCRD